MMSGKELGGMPVPNCPMHDAFNREFEREQQYNTNALNQSVHSKMPFLNQQQKTAYDKIVRAVYDGNGGIFFINAPGRTDKTFLISLILDTIQVQSEIALAVASSGIAATLFEGGHTTHSTLKLPLSSQTLEEPTCNITITSAMAKVLHPSCEAGSGSSYTYLHTRV